MHELEHGSNNKDLLLLLALLPLLLVDHLRQSRALTCMPLSTVVAAMAIMSLCLDFIIPSNSSSSMRFLLPRQVPTRVFLPLSAVSTLNSIVFLNLVFSHFLISYRFPFTLSTLYSFFLVHFPPIQFCFVMSILSFFFANVLPFCLLFLLRFFCYVVCTLSRNSLSNLA